MIATRSLKCVKVESAKVNHEVLTVEELKALFEELDGIYRVMAYVGGVTGLRVSDVIGMRWF